MGKLTITKWVMMIVALLGQARANAQSKTLPILHIETEGHQPITSQTVYVDATYYLEYPTNTENNMGSAAAPLRLEIRGRGNSSWRGQKKPYKIRLYEKLSVLGMPNNRHWVLLNFGDITIAGMQLGNLMGMAWNPCVRPVELVLNGDYKGLYLISENIRINKNRVNIYKQPDGNDDPGTIPYGWLVEVDNYHNPDQIVFRENQNWSMNITYHSPDTLSARQKEWLLAEFKEMNEAIYAANKASSTWEEYIDVDAMARFFIVQEVMDNPDGFHGSFFLHKDMGEDAKWIAGPLWDMNCMKREKTDYTFNMKVSYGFTPHWIRELIKDEDFCNAVRRAWAAFYPSMLDEWMDYIDEEILPCEQAYASNNERWPNANFKPLAENLDLLKSALLRNAEWFDQHLPGHGGAVFAGTEVPPSHYVVYTLLGVKVGEGDNYEDAVDGLPRGLYIINGRKQYVR